MDHDTPVVISFYTHNTPYAQEAKKLLNSCDRLGIECHIEGIHSYGTWEQNCAFKPAFILHKLRQFKRPVVWVDVDACFKKKPDWKQFFEHDLALRFNSHFHKEHPSYLMTGTMFVNYTPAALQLLADWQNSCEYELALAHPRALCTWDQAILARIIDKFPEARIGTLPLGYTKTIFWDTGVLSEEETIIEHGQASRRVHPISTTAQEFQKKKEMWNLGGILYYQPSMFRTVGDSCSSFVPFIRSFVIVMDHAAACTEEERQQFAFLARMFPYGNFIEISSSCTLETRLTLATMYMPQEIDRCLALTAHHVVVLNKMTQFLMQEGPSTRLKKKKAEELPAFFSKKTPENLMSFTSFQGTNNSLFALWDEKTSGINFYLHPHLHTTYINTPSNLVKIDDNRVHQVEVARHLRIPCF